MKFELDNFTPPPSFRCKFSIIAATKIFKLAIGGNALKCKRYKDFVQTALQLASC